MVGKAMILGRFSRIKWRCKTSSYNMVVKFLKSSKNNLKYKVSTPEICPVNCLPNSIALVF